MPGDGTRITKQNDIEERNLRLFHDLGERVKELTALYRMARVLNDEETPLPDLLQNLVAIFPPAWQYPDITAARIKFGDLAVVTPNFVSTRWLQRAEFATTDTQRGEISVFYLKETPLETEGPFLAEERALIDSLAEMLRVALNRRLAVAELARLNSELEQRVAERTQALQAKTHELETFAYSVAHDLKAPLRGIDGYSRLLLEGYLDRLDEEGRTFLHNIRHSASQMNQLIEDLLAYAQIERREFASSRIDLRPFIEALVDERKSDLRKTFIIIKVEGSFVDADVKGLAQIVRNYLDNAIKFTRAAPEPRIEVGAANLAGACRLWVSDNGAGLDMKYRDRIFDIFQRLHRAEEYPGTGVGLAIVRKAAERMGGRAWVESCPGQGATFFAEIPNHLTRAETSNHPA
jgi:signal transduction histidine kinase